jgi:hypothetical protein
VRLLRAMDRGGVGRRGDFTVDPPRRHSLSAWRRCSASGGFPTPLDASDDAKLTAICQSLLAATSASKTEAGPTSAADSPKASTSTTMMEGDESEHSASLPPSLPAFPQQQREEAGGRGRERASVGGTERMASRTA